MESPMHPAQMVSVRPVRKTAAKPPVGMVLLFGLPGAGKGTQAKELSKMWGVPHISTGDLLRINVAHMTPLGRAVKNIMDRGELVPDSLMKEMVEARLQKSDTARGCILDGFPRTLDQASWLIERLTTLRVSFPIFAVRIHLSRNQLLRRITGRRHCSLCQTTFNIYENPPKREGFCDLDNTALSQRPDDTEAIVKKRFELDAALTAPVIEYFRTRTQFIEVAGDGPVGSITARILAAVDRLSLVQA